jgi:hypothetical protein
MWTRSDAAGLKEGGLEVQEKEWGAFGVCWKGERVITVKHGISIFPPLCF